jgi:MYXO-CTERM domain-containing protein
MSRVRPRVLLLGLAAAQFTAVATARADIPADYKGTPYLGMPSVIPGRVELANLDIGGYGVSYAADHNRMNSAGYQPLSGNDYRPTEMNLPNICKTNVNPPPDAWVDGGAYPSPTDKSWYYIGYAHAHDWLRVTVDVKQAGTYTVSSNWASAGGQLGLSIWFNDGHSPVDPTHPHDGVNKTGTVTLKGTGNYHIWNSFPKFATVDLSAGLQVMTFHLEQFDHLQYGFLQFDLVGGSDAGTVPVVVADAGGADGMGALGQDDAGAGGAGSGAASSGGGVGSTSGAATGSSGAGGGGVNGGTSGAGGAATGGAATPNGISPTSGAGCACATARNPDTRSYSGAGALLLGGVMLLRRRTRR